MFINQRTNWVRAGWNPGLWSISTCISGTWGIGWRREMCVWAKSKLCHMCTFTTVLCFSCVNSYSISNSQSSIAVQNYVIFWPSALRKYGHGHKRLTCLTLHFSMITWFLEVIKKLFFLLWSHETLGTIHSAALCNVTEDFYIQTLW